MRDFNIDLIWTKVQIAITAWATLWAGWTACSSRSSC